MKNLFITVLFAFASSLAGAEPAPRDAVEKMAAQSEFVMNCGLCRVVTGPSATTSLTLIFPPPVGVRIIDPVDYNWLKDAGEKKAVSGRYVMTERIIEACTANWSGNRCLAFRSMFRQEWPTGKCVGATGKVYRARQTP